MNNTLRFKINGGRRSFFFVIYADPRQLFFDPPFQLISRISQGITKKFIDQNIEVDVSLFTYCKRLRNILEIPMLSEVNKVFKDNPNFVSSLLYFLPIHSPFILSPV